MNSVITETRECTYTEFMRRRGRASAFLNETGHVLIISHRKYGKYALLSIPTYLAVTEFATDEKTLETRRILAEMSVSANNHR